MGRGPKQQRGGEEGAEDIRNVWRTAVVDNAAQQPDKVS